MQILNITRWPVALLFAGAGGAATLLSFASFNLFTMAMANFDLIGRAGLIAVQDGALLQLAEIVLFGAVSLGGWMIFKIFESELIHRYRAWAERTNPKG
ncbi:hypothetical protein LZA78_15210 [Sinirhodobacter sp. WL0062]|uniref:MotA/TolQ/ExbB proton channel domain-containing protein n=1 Tax=Rhodobacter flavimaris TaxID=2907145 RepID=A0ABS8YYH6_9RHOB|nr:hypothetical protein [Sinirhodobacter sp. WL0062]MCE5974836.1 hypothetical protein [Sinirhodobacter sp. WL0062]